MVAIEATPLREMVGYIESCWRGHGVFVVDEGDGLGLGVSICAAPRLNDDVAAEEVGMGEDQLGDVISKRHWSENSVGILRFFLAQKYLPVRIRCAPAPFVVFLSAFSRLRSWLVGRTPISA